MTCKYAHEVVDTMNEALEMVFIPTKDFDNDPQRAFQLMMNSKVAVTSDEIDPWNLFVQMRKISKKDPKRFDGLAEKIVV